MRHYEIVFMVHPDQSELTQSKNYIKHTMFLSMLKRLQKLLMSLKLLSVLMMLFFVT